MGEKESKREREREKEERESIARKNGKERMENVYNLSLPPEWWVGTSEYFFFLKTSFFACCLVNFELYE